MQADGALDGTFYDRLGVRPDVDLVALRLAYRRRARDLHPDLHPDPPEDGPAHRSPTHQEPGSRQLQMALVNEAWAVLSDPNRRQAYDRTLRAAVAAPPAVVVRPAAPRHGPTVLGRKEAWLDGVGMRIRFLATMAGRSAVQTLLLRHPGTARGDWEAALPAVVDHLSLDTGERVRVARVAGAAPLDLANAAALIGLVSYADVLVGDRRPGAPEDAVLRRALLADRMFDTLAHELPRGLVRTLGDNPRAARRLGGRGR